MFKTRILNRVSVFSFWAVLISVVFLYFGLWTNKNYGVTWDFPHHFNGGLKRLGLKGEDLSFGGLPYGPLGEILPILSYLLFHKKSGFLAFDEAYHLPIIFFGALGILICYFLTKEVFGKKAGILAAVVLSLYPRWVGHIHNNMKDVFSAVGFGASILMYLIALKSKKNKIGMYVLAGIIWGISFNFKINLMLVPAVVFIHQGFMAFLKKKERVKHLFAYGISGMVSCFFIWSLFWEDPLGKLFYTIEYFSKANQGFVVLYFGKIYQVMVNTPWHIGLGNLIVATPLLVILFFIIGFLAIIWQTIKTSDSRKAVLAIWFLIVTLKYLSPKMGIIDGIRQYLEVVFPLAGIAGYGGLIVFEFLRKKWSGFRFFLFCFLVAIYLFKEIIPVAGYETSYFSEIIGGIRGARGKFDIEYWGHSMKEAGRWLNKNARENSAVYTVMAGHLLEYYLRDDIKVIEASIGGENKEKAKAADFIVILNRKSFFDRYDKEVGNYLKNKKVVFTIKRKGVVLLWILGN